MVRKNSQFHILVPSVGDSRTSHVTGETLAGEECGLLVISAHRLARQRCIFLLHAFVVFIAPMLKI